jgi:anti-sigma factor RsiW
MRIDNTGGRHWFMHYNAVFSMTMRGKRDACEHVTARLSDYLESQLSPGDTHTMAAHLSSCLACKRRLADLQRTISLLSQIPKPRTPQNLVDSILNDAISQRDDTSDH